MNRYSDFIWNTMIPISLLLLAVLSILVFVAVYMTANPQPYGHCLKLPEVIAQIFFNSRAC